VSLASDFIRTVIITDIIILIINKELNYCCLLNNTKMYCKDVEWGDVEWIHLDLVKMVKKHWAP
jgi:hypothetical protein